MTSPFDWLNAINDTKKDMFAEGDEKYPAFMVNRGLSYFPDTVMQASEMNRMAHLDSDMQFCYLINSVRKRRRFSKWAKAGDNDDLDAISAFYKYSTRRAQEVLRVLTPAQLKDLRGRVKKNG
jgi:hypothetical protein